MSDGRSTGSESAPVDPLPAEGGPTGCRLGPGDLELLRLLGDGLSVEQVARHVQASERTVRRRCRTICDRLEVHAPIQAVVWAARRGLL